MTLVTYKYRRIKTISRTGRASAETIYDSALRSSLRESGLAVGGLSRHFLNVATSGLMARLDVNPGQQFCLKHPSCLAGGILEIRATNSCTNPEEVLLQTSLVSRSRL